MVWESTHSGAFGNYTTSVLPFRTLAVLLCACTHLVVFAQPGSILQRLLDCEPFELEGFRLPGGRLGFLPLLPLWCCWL